MGESKRRWGEEYERIAKGSEAEKRKIIDGITRTLIYEGKIIEAGWIGMRIQCIPDNAPEAQLDDMRAAFFAGAQHLFGSIMTALDPGDEMTDRDEFTMESISQELERFVEDFKRQQRAKKGGVSR